MRRLFQIVECMDALREKIADGESLSADGFDHSRPYLSGIRVAPEPKTELTALVYSLFGLSAESGILADRLSLKLGVERYRREFEKVFERSKWRELTCPLCGEPAGLARIAGDGGRRLICHFCWTEWDHTRLSCAYCGGEASEYDLFTAEGGELRVYRGGACLHYVKTLMDDQAIRSPSCWDLKTLFIDERARQQGFLRPCPSLIGVDFST